MSRDVALALTKYFQDLLSEEGYHRGDARWEEDSRTSHLVFKYSGGTMVLTADADDTSFVRLIYPNFWPLESDNEYANALQAISIINARCKGVKVYATTNNENMMASVEFLISPDEPSLPASLFLRYVGMVQHGANEFAKVMRDFEASE